MVLIAHRGNIDGPNADENKPKYINKALDAGYDVEIDVWYIDREWYSGHNEPQYKISFAFLINTKLWIHCKHYKALEKLIELEMELNFFYHTDEDYVLTSNKYIWAYPGNVGSSKTICVLPEAHNTPVEGFGGICSDFIEKYKND